MHSKRTRNYMSSRDRECPQCALKQVKWCCLPSPALRKIYCFASPVDQFNMSLVCHRWSKQFHLSSATETFRFALSERQLLSKNCRKKLIRFVEKHSTMFQHVEIECTYVGYDFINTWGRLFRKFLKILTRNIQLISFEFHYVEDLSFFLFHDNEVCRAIAEFMESQHHLKMVVFRDCYFKLSEGLKILRNVIEQNKNSLSHVVLQSFIFNSYSSDDENLPILVDLPKLTTLGIDYSLIFENIFTVARQGTLSQTVKNGQKPLLSKIILHCKETLENNFQGLTSTNWQELKLLYPNLNLELNYTKCPLYQGEEKLFIVPSMPVTRLIFTNDAYLKAGTRGDEFFRHLLDCQVNTQLDYLCLYLYTPIRDTSSSLIPFIQACKKLKCFVLSVVYKTIGIDLLLASFLDNRPEFLEEVSITVSNLEGEDNYSTFKSLINSYSTRFGTAEIKLRAFYDDGNRHNII